MSRGKPCFISIHAPRTGSDPCSGVDIWLREISIHAPRTGSDDFLKCRVVVEVVISIHAPRTGSDVREADVDGQLLDFNPRSPHGERPLISVLNILHAGAISIHAPRTGSDGNRTVDFSGLMEFQSTLPARGATGGRAEGSSDNHFNPRSPHGERHRMKRFCLLFANFNPRSPHGERLDNGLFNEDDIAISIHAPRTGSDATLGEISGNRTYFNPRSPHGERPDARYT